MENPEGVLNLLDEFTKMKSKDIPNDLEEYLLYVAASGDPVYQWSLIKSLYRQKLLNVITEFYENCPMMDIPLCRNVDPFNYEGMKNSLLERLDSFSSAPFTIQRISELLTTPRKQYNRVDKFMRAIEKNIWVVSTREPGQREANSAQDAAGNLVNGVASRVRVTVKHPKRGKSIEERIKSGHPQLIDDDEEEDDDDDPMETKAHSEILPNNDTEDTPLQCTSVKDLLEKYENGTIFCGTEEKTVQLEEPAATPGEAVTSTVAATSGSVNIESTSEQESHVEGVEENEPMEIESDADLLASTDSEDTPMECTSLKDLLDKQENENMFCENEEKTVTVEEPSTVSESGETVSSTVAVAAESSDNIESSTEQGTPAEDKDWPMGEKPDSEVVPSAETEDPPLECSSLKDLLDKQEGGTMFCEKEEKTDKVEESAVPGETVTSTVDVTAGSDNIESTSEQENQEEEGNNLLSHYMLNEQS